MKNFFKVKTLEQVLGMTRDFSSLGSETIQVSHSFSRVLAQDIQAQDNMPGFRRSTMDGYAVSAASTFGASESSPAWLEIKGTIKMGETPDFSIGQGQAAEISTGGMLPKGADAVVMVEHTEVVDETSVEIYKSVAPLQNVIDESEDFKKKEVVLERGTFIRPQEAGLIAGLGIETIQVYQQPTVAIISTGDEIIPITQDPKPGEIRDINSYTLAGFITDAGAMPILYPLVSDDPTQLKNSIKKALAQTDMVLVSGGSSVGTKDYTIDVLKSLPDTTVLVHGISISPGKPTILARSGEKQVWGLPGQVTSAMVVLKIVVLPFLDRLKGLEQTDRRVKVTAILSRNVASAQGRRDFVRVRLNQVGENLTADPVLGKSGLIRTMIYADGLLEIGEDLEGLEKNKQVEVILL